MQFFPTFEWSSPLCLPSSVARILWILAASLSRFPFAFDAFWILIKMGGHVVSLFSRPAYSEEIYFAALFFNYLRDREQFTVKRSFIVHQLLYKNILFLYVKLTLAHTSKRYDYWFEGKLLLLKSDWLRTHWEKTIKEVKKSGIYFSIR